MVLRVELVSVCGRSIVAIITTLSIRAEIDSCGDWSLG